MTTFELNLIVLFSFYLLQFVTSSSTERQYYIHCAKQMPWGCVLGLVIGIAFCMLGNLMLYAMCVGITIFVISKSFLHFWYPDVDKQRDTIYQTLMSDSV